MLIMSERTKVKFEDRTDLTAQSWRKTSYILQQYKLQISIVHSTMRLGR